MERGYPSGIILFFSPLSHCIWCSFPLRKDEIILSKMICFLFTRRGGGCIEFGYKVLGFNNLVYDKSQKI